MDDDHSPRDPEVDLWVGALDGPDGPLLRAAFAADRSPPERVWRAWDDRGGRASLVESRALRGC